MAEPFPQEKLLDLYKIAIEEYRFEVRLGWDRATYFFVLNSAILSVATGLLKMDSPPFIYIFIALIFAFGLGTSLIGAKSITTAHQYYRRTIIRKTVIEERLGLGIPLPDMHPSLDLTIATTKGHDDRLRILTDPEGWAKRSHRRGTITFWLRSVLLGMALVDGIGVCTAIFIGWQKWAHASSIAPQYLWKLI